jgi:hypothetical protein
MYCQMMVTTGMLISGKISVGIDNTAVPQETGPMLQARRRYAAVSEQSERSP